MPEAHDQVSTCNLKAIVKKYALGNKCHLLSNLVSLEIGGEHSNLTSKNLASSLSLFN